MSGYSEEQLDVLAKTVESDLAIAEKVANESGDFETGRSAKRATYVFDFDDWTKKCRHRHNMLKQ